MWRKDRLGKWSKGKDVQNEDGEKKKGRRKTEKQREKMYTEGNK